MKVREFQVRLGIHIKISVRQQKSAKHAPSSGILKYCLS